MPKGGCSKTPQSEDFSLSNDMVEKQTGKKVTPAFLWGCCSLSLESLKPWHCLAWQEVALGTYRGIYIGVLVLCQLMGLGLFPCGCNPSQEVLCSPGPESAEQWGLLWKILYCKFCGFLGVCALSCGRPNVVMVQVCPG